MADVFYTLSIEQGKTKLTLGFTEAMVKAGPEETQKVFDRLNAAN